MSTQNEADLQAAIYEADVCCVSHARIALSLGVQRSAVTDAIQCERERRGAPDFAQSVEDRQRIDAIVNHVLMDAARADDEDLFQLENCDSLAPLDDD